ncbi:MAG: peptidoglycan synthetase [Bacteroidetes bacterium]|nr:peptidoglycan synthetase [Bacteroidota bacterium]
MKHIHFIAIGGAIMHQLALALLRQGHIISGSDDEINDPAKTNLLKSGILPTQQGWFPAKITTDIDAIVLGMHAKADNPELIQAQKLGIPIYSFPQYIYEVCKDKRRVAIAGSHGKTTITSMVMHILKKCGKEFDFLVGAKVPGFEQSVQLTDAPTIILEGDEYPASVVEKRPKIFFYHPEISVLNGIAWDHINVFPTYENYCSQFEQYLQLLKPGMLLLYNNEDAEVVRIVEKSGQHLKKISYGVPRFRYEDGVAILDTDGGDVRVSVFGRHNLIDLEAAVSVCEALGILRQDSYEAIADFTGAARRLEKLIQTESIVAYRDFAHAPSKLKATLDAVREAYPIHELIACFELHTYSSLSENFLKEYAGSMDSPDHSLVFFSNHALTLKGLPHLDTNQVYQSFKRIDLKVVSDKEKLINLTEQLISTSKKPVCLLLMSSGTFDGIDWKNVVSQSK